MLKRMFSPILAVAAVLLLVACGPSGPELTQTYSGTLGNVALSFGYPEGWTIDDSRPGQLAVQRDARVLMLIAAFDGVPEDAPDELKTTEGLLESLHSAYLDFYSDLEVLEDPSRVTVGGIAGQGMMMSARDPFISDTPDQGDVTRRIYLLAGVTDEVAYFIEAGSPGSEWETHEPAFNAIIRSITFGG
ncbi:MAG: hypothetical protein Kow00124_25510 [Anaerolineae bacterium]